MQGTQNQMDPGPVTTRRGGAVLGWADACPRFGRSDIRRRLKPLTFMNGGYVRSVPGLKGREDDPSVQQSRPLSTSAAGANADCHRQPLDRLP